MLNYSNLNDMEFEALCKDIMERMLDVSLRRFGPGRDGGVDLTNDVSTKDIVVQVKHYKNSTTNQLVRSLKNELSKVIELNPNQYYICCSRELSVENINELYQLFKSYMATDRQIITLIEIEEFLKQEKNKDILKKHFKLWLDDTGILNELSNDNIFVDCDTFLDDVEELQKYFVRTSAFDKALRALEKDQTLCIIGDPGVGKSITSKMLVLYYASQNYKVRYTSNVTDVGSLKESLSRDPERKEIILLDDCFGQAYFEMKSTQSSELIFLIKYVKRHPNKILILNSRVTIFQEAQQRQRDLMQCLERKDLKIHVLDINALSLEEKAKILYNHLTFSGIPNEYFENIITERRYWNIINHRNYNPRVIEFVCNPKRYESVQPDKYFNFIKKHLNNPKEIWKDEYEDRLKSEDRILLQTIYSLTTTTVGVELVKLCFDRRIEKIPTIDKTINQFDRALQRLNKGFIRIIDNKGAREICVQNPSINDFLDGRLSCDNVERTELISSICTVNQLRLLPREERTPYVVNLIQEGKMDQLIFLDQQLRMTVIGRCVLSECICTEKYRSEFLGYLLNRHYGSFLIGSLLPIKLNPQKQILDTEIWDFYDLKKFFEESDNLYRFLSSFELEDGVEFISSIDECFSGQSRNNYIQQVKEYLSDAIDEYLNIDAMNYETDVDVESAIDSAGCFSKDGYDVDVDEAVAILDEYIQEEALDDFEGIVSKLPEHFKYLADNIEASDFNVDGSDSLVEDYLSCPPGYYERDDDKEYEDQSSYSQIDAMFQR